MTSILRMLIILAGASLPLSVMAQAMSDPTRPPSAARAATDGTAPSAAPAPTPVLQFVMIGRDRSAAIISGQRYEVGDRIGEARIVRIAETEVVLRSAEGTTTLKLFPQVEKRMRTQAPKPGAAPNPQKKSAMTTREAEA